MVGAYPRGRPRVPCHSLYPWDCLRSLTTIIVRYGFAHFTILNDGEGKKGTDCLLGTLYFHVTRSSKNMGSSLIATRIWLVVSRSRTVTV